MAQDPFLTDQIQIEPGAAGTRLIRRATDGSIEFVDPNTGTVTLAQVAGLSTIAGVLVVGTTGSYTSIQDAIDAVSSSASITSPWAILVQAGVYTEDVSLYRDGVFIIGMGGVTIRSLETTADGAGANHTIIIQADLGTIPQNVLIQGCRIENIHTNYACVRVLGAASSSVGLGMITIRDCALVASQAGGNRPLWATAANNITWEGGSSKGTGTLGLVYVEECASLTLDGVRDLPALQLDYDTGADLPLTVGSAYRVLSCDSIALGNLLATPFSATLSGAGSLRVVGCANASKLLVDGDRTLTLVGSQVGELSLLGTTAATLISSQKGLVVSAAGATLAEPIQRGSVAFAASASESVAFVTAQPDSTYSVSLEVGAQSAGEEVPWVSSKTAAGFDITFASAQTLPVDWMVLRVMGGATN